MDKKLLQSLSAIISKIPKKDLEKNLEKAKSVLKNSKKEDFANKKNKESKTRRCFKNKKED